ncbi:leukocyte immunoglobulin-like receptor subfamily A member 5 isoform X2 [Cavia porcellus]|uniref:leukocyte immunoglobulin-like receptor subfamily A member 5 isoform X2 n=1 Tax=Cavia porcellus TaxID=10141 RepID=UPI002FDFD39B
MGMPSLQPTARPWSIRRTGAQEALGSRGPAEARGQSAHRELSSRAESGPQDSSESRAPCRATSMLLWNPSGYSEPSEPLELVIIGAYSKPSLSALPRLVVTSARKMTLQCMAQLGFDRFILTKAGGDKLSWTLDSQRGPSEQAKALFHVSPVTPRQRWTFRCCSYYWNQSQLWSETRETLELQISGPGPIPCGCFEPYGKIDIQVLWLFCYQTSGVIRAQ